MEERLHEADDARKAATASTATFATQTTAVSRVSLQPVVIPAVRVSVPEPVGSVDEVLLTPELVSSESINVWPDEAAEAAFLAESRGGNADVSSPPAVAVAPKVDEKANSPMPALEELVSRIPAEARELLDELFRAKFTAVRRVKQTDLKG